jgi:hypothetical protein
VDTQKTAAEASVEFKNISGKDRLFFKYEI